MIARRVQWLLAVLTLIAGGVFVYAQNPVTVQSGTITANQGIAGSANWLVKVMDAAGNARGANVDASNRLAVLADINNGSTTVTEAATITANQSNSALTAAVIYGFDGTTDSRLRTRAGAINSADVGLVTRPFLPSDGTNTLPAGDAAARAIHVATDTGEVAPMASATTTNAATACNILSAASTNSTSCKGSAGNFYGYEVFNTTTTVYYLRLYNSSSAPTCSSATGFIRSIPVPPASAAGQVGGAVSNQAVPVGYSTGIGYCLTGGGGSTDNTNAAVGIFGEIRYK